MSNADFAGEARVVIRADTSEFASQLRTRLENIKIKPYQVKVQPDTRGFAEAIRTSLSRITIAPFKVRVEPDFTGFNRKLQTGINEAKTGLTIPIPVSAIGGATSKTKAADVTAAPAASTKAAATTAKLTGAEKELANAVNAGAFARKKLSSSLTETERRAERLLRTEAFLAAAVKAGNKALDEQNAEAREAALALEAKARAELKGIQNAQARAAAPGLRAEAVEAEAAAKVEADRQKALQETADLEKQFLDDHADAVARNTAIDEKATTAFEQDQKKRRDAMRRDLDERAAVITKNAQLPIVNEALAKDKTFELQAKAAQDFALAQRFVSQSTVKTTAAQQALSKATLAVDSAQDVFNTSLLTSDRLLQRQAADALLAARALEVLRLETLGLAQAQAARTAADAAESAARAKTAGTTLRGFGAQLAQFAGVRGATLAASSAFIAGTVAAVAFGKAIKQAAALQSELNVFRVVAGATADEMERTAAVARELGADLTLPAVSAVDAAQAISLLSRAGLDVEDALGGARGVLQLATAAQITNAEATELAASALNAFGLAGTEAVHVADVLANSANLAQGSITDVGIAMQQASAVARQVGLSFTDTVALLTLLARNGIRGSDAGTALRVAFTRLTAPTKEAAAVLKELNVNVLDAQGRLRPAIFAEIAEAQKDLSVEAQNANAKIIFGVDALRAYSIAAREGVGSLKDTRTALGEQGSAAELAGARMSGLTGATENLKNQLANLGLTIGGVLAPPLTVMTIGFSTAIKTMNDMFQAVGTLIGGVGRLSEALNDLGRVRIGDFGLGDALLVLPGTVKIVKAAVGEPFDAAEANADQLIAKIEELQRAIDKSKKTTGPLPSGTEKEINASTKALSRLAERVRETGNINALQAFAKNFTQSTPAVARALEDGIIDPVEKAQLETTRLGKIFLKAVPKDLIIGGFSVDLSGINAAIQEVSNFGPDVRSRIEDASREAARGARGFGTPIGVALRQSLNAAFFGALATVRTGLKKLELEFLQLEVSGAPNSALQANLNKQIEGQDKIIADAQERLAGLGKKKDPKSKTARQKTQAILKQALQDKKGFQDQIEGLAAETAADAKQKADDIEKAQNEADQAILDALSPKTRRLETQELIASGTEQVQDNIAVAKAQQQNNLHMIAVIRKSFKDKKKAGEIIADLKDENIRLGQQIQKDTQAFVDAGSDAFNVNLSLAESTGNLDKVLSVIDRRIKDLVAKLKKSGELVGEARKKVQTEVNNLFGQREDIENQKIADQIALGQSILDLTGNKNPLLRAIEAAIAETIKDIRAAKKAGTTTVKLRTELNNFLKQRKDVLEEAKDKADEQQGTSAFDILQGAAETFRATGGNIIGGNQPFAGPTGFTADLAQFLRRQRPGTLRTQIPGLDTSDVPGRAIARQISGIPIKKTTEDKFTQAILDLVAALDRNTEATSGNSTTGLTKSAADIDWKRVTSLPKNWQAVQARRVRESRSGI